jgi:uncharacterized membrane protein YbhN (UPF0104 family)
LATALATQWDEVRAEVTLSVPRLAGALALVVISMVMVAEAWATLLKAHSPSMAMHRIFYTAQPAKYLPGGFAQPVGQVMLAVDEGVRAGVAGTAFVIHAAESALAGALLGSALVFVSDAPSWIRWVSGIGMLAPLVLWRPAITWTAGLLGRLTGRRVAADLVPSQRSIVVAFVWVIGSVLLTSAAFVVLSPASMFEVGPASLLAAYAFAWTVGYLALPIPTGLGIREAALAIVLPVAGIGSVVAVSALHRLVTMLAEFGVFIATRHRR